MLYPRSVGGDEIEPGAYVLAVEELARADGSVGWCASIANSIGLFAPYLGLDAARRVFGDPRATCAWGPPNECQGIAVPGGYRVTGRWDFASGCRHASWIGAHGTVVEPDGSLRLNNFGRPTIRTWLFPAEEATLLDNWNPIGLRGTASESYTVKDLFVPEELTGTREDPTLRRDPHRLLGVVELAGDGGPGPVAGDVAAHVGGRDAGLGAQRRDDRVVDVIPGDRLGADGEQHVHVLTGLAVQRGLAGRAGRTARPRWPARRSGRPAW